MEGFDQRSLVMKLSKLLRLYSSSTAIKPSTVEQYRYVLLCFSKHLGRSARLTDLTPKRVNGWLCAIESKLAADTIKSRRATVLALWKFASDLDRAPPAKLIRSQKRRKRPIRTLTRQQCQQLVHAARELPGTYNGYLRCDYYPSLIRAFLESACRAGDLHSLEWPDVRDAGGRLTIVQRKTGHPRRVQFSDALMADLARWHGDSGLIWPTGCRTTSQRVIGALGLQLGFSVTTTTLRKTAITDVERQCPGAGWIFAGHTSPTTTRQWYTDADRAYRDLPRPDLF